MTRPFVAQYSGVVLDIDGVCLTGSTPIAGALDAVAQFRDLGIALLFATNNAIRTPAQVADHLGGAGFEVRDDEILTSSTSAALLLEPGTRCYVLGTDGLRVPLRDRGCVIVDDPFAAEVCVVGMDWKLTYNDLAEAALAIGAGARFVGTNPDANVPSERGRLPAAGAILAALTKATGVEPLVAGKPAPAMFDAAEALLPPGRRLMVGDRLDTDVAGAAAQGWDTALVLSGVATAEDVARSTIAPTRVFDDLAGLLGP